MNRDSRRKFVWAWALTLLAAQPVWAVVNGVKGGAKASVAQLHGVFPVQSDVGQEIVPDTKPEPPAIARARLDRPTGNGDFTAAGQCLALMAAPNLSGVGNPNDVGLDLGAFSNDDFTSWLVEGIVTEIRTIVLSATDVGTDNVQLGGVGRTRSRVLLSGIMLIAANDPQKDLTGVRVSLNVQVVLRQANRPTVTPLTGEVVLAGGPNGNVIIDHTTGALANVFLPIFDFSGFIPELPMVRAILFTGVNLPYEYDVLLDQPFELELTANSQVATTPGGVGAAATFGVPPGELGSVLQRVKKSDAGRQLNDLITSHVDTTGQAYAQGGGGWPFSAMFPACGMLGMESAGLLAAGGGLAALRGRRRRRARRNGL